MQKCECGELMIQAKAAYSLFDTNLGDYKALICKKCNQTLYYGEEVEKVRQKAKEKNLI